MCELHIEPTSAPQNIRDIDKTSTSILLSWDPPPVEDQNGLIRSYSISVTRLSTGYQWYLNSNSSYTNVTIEGLEPYNSYAFQLAAYTIAIGPYSDAIVIDTLEDGQYNFTQQGRPQHIRTVRTCVPFSPQQSYAILLNYSDCVPSVL